MIRVEHHTGPRDDLRLLFELAEDSARELDGYIGKGLVLVAREGDVVVGHLQLAEAEAPDELEVKNMAVQESHQGRGIGRALMEAAIARARERGCARVQLDVNERNETALSLYRSLGFETGSPRRRSCRRTRIGAATGPRSPTPTGGISSSSAQATGRSSQTRSRSSMPSTKLGG